MWCPESSGLVGFFSLQYLYLVLSHAKSSQRSEENTGGLLWLSSTDWLSSCLNSYAEPELRWFEMRSYWCITVLSARSFQPVYHNSHVVC